MRVEYGDSCEHERLFFALWPDDGVRAQLAVWASGGGGRPVPADGYHMTLAFAGDVGAGTRRALEAGAARVSEEAFVCVLDAAMGFGTGDIEALTPSRPPPALLRLAGRLQRLVDDATGATGQRPYRPHVTLARGTPRPHAGARGAPVVWAVRDYVLCRSRRDRPGFYDIVARWPLA